jgi:hypothetical protein
MSIHTKTYDPLGLDYHIKIGVEWKPSRVFKKRIFFYFIMYHVYINMKVATEWWKYNRKKEVSLYKLMRI